MLAPSGNVIEVRYPDVQVDTDEALRPVELINENNTRWSFTWDHADRLYEETLFDGLTRRYEYDERGRLTERDSADYSDRIQYDDGDRITLIERTSTSTGDSKGLEPSSLRFEYDEAGRLIGEGQGDQALAYAYDELDNLTHLTLPDGRQLNSLYYGSGHLLQLNLDQLEISHFERDALHREVMRTQSRLTSRTGYDRMGRKAWQFASPLDSRKLSAHQNPHVVASELVERDDNTVYRRYHYNSAGELESVEDKARPEQRFDYDRTGRLMRHWPAPMREEWFGYDRAANRILPGNDSNPRYMTVGDNRLREIDGTHYAYDGWGNLTRRLHGEQRQQFDYDSDNRLIRAQVYQHHQLTSDTHYHYDPLGRRIRKVVTQHDPKTAHATTHQTDFIWQGLRLLTETRRIPERPAETRVYCYEQNSYAPLARIDTAGGDLNTPSVYYFHTDALGTPKEVTSVDGEIVWQADYTAWGEIDQYRVQQIEQPLRFQGQYADDETGLYYTTFRYYDPHAGRFSTQDPIGLAGGWIRGGGMQKNVWVSENLVTMCLLFVSRGGVLLK